LRDGRPPLRAVVRRRSARQIARDRPPLGPALLLMSSLLPWLLVGDKAMAKDRTELRKRKVKYILNVTPPMTEGGVANFFQNEGSLEYLRLPLRDVASDTIIPHIGAAVEFLQRARVRADGRVLVHCNEGKSRSAAIAAAFLIKAYNKTPDEALEALRFARPQAEPREAFVKQLRTLEPAILHSEVDGFEDSAAATAATAAAARAAGPSIGPSIGPAAGPPLPRPAAGPQSEPEDTQDSSRACGPSMPKRAQVGPALPPAKRAAVIGPALGPQLRPADDAEAAHQVGEDDSPRQAPSCS
jgi:hypothetical protein